MTNNTQRPLRILRVIARLNVGGPAIHVALLTHKFNPPHSDAYESRLVTGRISADEGDMAYYADERGVEPHYIDGLGREIHPLRDVGTLVALYRLMREYQPDIVHTHTAKAGFVGRVAAWLAGVPVIVHTFHGHVFRGYFGPGRTWVFLTLERLVGRITDAILTLTEGLRRELADEFHVAPRRRLTVLPLGLDLTHLIEMPRKQGAWRAQWGIPPDVPLIGIVGRLVPVKNHDLFLAAALKIRQQHPDAHFIIIGDGEQRPHIEAQIDALGLRDVTTITGWQRDLAPAYSDMDVLVISSLNEGTPVSVIEALAAGCPVVATAVGGLPDLLEGGRLGRLVSPGDAAALAGAIATVIDQPPDTTTARDLMHERYGIDRLVSDLDQLYRALLKKKQARRRRGG